MKRALFIAPALLIALVAIALIAPSFVDWNKYKPQAIEQIKKATGYDVALNGDLGMSVLPSPRVYIENVEIKAPAGSAEEHLIRVKRLDVNLAMGPLLGGKVDFSSVKLVEPDIALQVFDDGRRNWMTPELEAMTAKNPSAPAPERNTPAIALRDVSIEKGKFVYRAGKGAKPTEVTDVNVDLSADTLQGPFDVDGSFTTAGQTIDIDAKTGKMMPDTNSISLNMDASAKPLDAAVKYAGVVGLSEPYDIQGETEVEISSLSDKLKNSGIKPDGDSVTLKGLITGSKEKAEVKGATIEIGGNEFKGDIAAAFNPAKLSAKLAGSKAVNLDSILMKNGSNDKNAAAKGNILPPSIELPSAFEADVAVNVPGLIYNGSTYKDVALKFAKKDSTFTAAFAAGEMPGKGNIDAVADMKFASKSVSKTGGEVYTDPTVTGTIKGQSANMALTAESLTGMKNPALEAFKTGAIDGAFSITPDVLELKSSTLRLGDMSMKIAAAYSSRGTRPAIALDVTADAMNFDDIAKKFGGGQPSGSLDQTLRTFAIPYDVDFDIGVQNATYNGEKITGLRATGTARENALKFTNLSAQSFAGASVKLEGGVSDLKNLKGIDVKVAGESSDVKGLAKMAKIDPATLPAAMDKAALNVSASGDISKLAVKASVKALGGEVIASGDVADPLTQLKISGMAVQLKHGNLNQALRIFNPAAPQYASWNKPIDVYAEIETSGKAHNFRNIKGNLANATVSGSFSFDQSGAKPAMKGDLTFGDMILVSDANAAAAVQRGADAPAAAGGGGKWSSVPINAAWMNAFDADISLKAKSLAFETWQFSAPSLAFILRDGALQIKDMQSGLYGGKMAMNATMKSNAGKTPLAVEGAAKFDNVSVENLVTSMARGTRLIKGKGQVSLDTSIKTSGTSQQALIGNLGGSGTVSGKDIVLEGFDLQRFGRAMAADNKPKDTLLGLYKTSIKGGSTAFDTLSGAFGINSGVMGITKMDLVGPTADVTTKGNINLPAWTIATDHTITLKGDAAAEVPPFTIKFAGSLDNPGQTFGQGLLQDYFNRKLERKIQGLITEKIGDEKLGGALGSLLGIPQQPKQPAAQVPVAEPAAGDEIAPVQSEPAPVQEVQPEAQGEKRDEQPTPEEAIQGVLEGLINGN